MEGQGQIVFVDTPGLFRPRRRLDRAMVAAAWGGAADADVIVLLIEAHRGLTEGVEGDHRPTGDRIPQGQPVALAINKIDRVKAETLLALAEELNDGLPLREDLHDLGRKGLWRRRPAGMAGRRRCRKARGSTPRTRSPTCRCG